MENAGKIRKVIREIAGAERSYFFVAEVTGVDGATCTVKKNTLVLTGVKLLQSACNKSQLLITPKVGSNVLVADLGGNARDLAVIQFSEIEKIEFQESAHTMANGDVLKEELSKMSKRIDGIIDALNKAVPTPQDGGAGLQTTIKAGLSLITEKEDFKNIENTTIKHGS
jgi:hypothetical protein